MQRRTPPLFLSSPRRDPKQALGERRDRRGGRGLLSAALLAGLAALGSAWMAGCRDGALSGDCVGGVVVDAAMACAKGLCLRGSLSARGGGQ